MKLFEKKLVRGGISPRSHTPYRRNAIRNWLTHANKFGENGEYLLVSGFVSVSVIIFDCLALCYGRLGEMIDTFMLLCLTNGGIQNKGRTKKLLLFF